MAPISIERMTSFQSIKPVASEYRASFSALQGELTGEFKRETPNVYKFPAGTVVSWELDQGKAKNPTVGLIPQGTYDFDTSYEEVMTVLEASDSGLKFELPDRPAICVVKGQSLTIPKGIVFKVSAVDGPVLYLCKYK